MINLSSNLTNGGWRVPYKLEDKFGLKRTNQMNEDFHMKM